MLQEKIKEIPFFSLAQPIWVKGLEKEMNITIGLRTCIHITKDQKAVLNITGSSVYKFYINGDFAGHGPAVAAHGYYRVDQWDISEKVQSGNNIIAIEVAGYNADSFYLLNQPSFVQAEVAVDGLTLAATGALENGFEIGILKERIQKVQRYSYQRPFSEVYKIAGSFGKWRNDIQEPFESYDYAIVDRKELLPRGVKYPDFSIHNPVANISAGSLEIGVKVEKYWKNRSLTLAGTAIGGFKEPDLEVIPSLEIQEMKTIANKNINTSYSELTEIKLNENSFQVLDFGINLTGFIGLKVKADIDTRLFLTFDEVLSEGDVNYSRLGCVNIISYELAKGEHALESFEPYTMRYLKIMVLKGSCTLNNIYLRDYANSDIYKSEFKCSDEKINRVFEAGKETFRQNALDIFMDCPSRERAGWLCDSFFTARVAADLSGNTLIEKNFLENYLLPESYPHIPDGMLPMCYPSDHYNGSFIPNWALWLVIQLEEYLERSGNYDMIDAFRNKIMNLFDYFKKFKNEDGLLENLESWIFVEWSKANDFVKDVNYPTNMLFAGALEAAGKLYKEKELLDEAESIKETIRKQAFNGKFFVDNAIRKEGKLIVQDNKTEACQYYAFYFKIADPHRYPELWNTLLNKFGPDRKDRDDFPDVHMANAFIGNYLRLEILSRFKCTNKMLKESLDFFLYMAERTGTLWENIGAYASCNHGFASHVVHCFYRDILGVYRIDTQKKVIYIRFGDVDIEWCCGIIPIANKSMSLEWKKEEGKLYYSCSAPEGYSIEVENCAGIELISAVS